MGIAMLARTEVLGVCRLYPQDGIPLWAVQSAFYSVTKTFDELSIVCPQEVIPLGVRCERDWRMFEVLGPLDFSLVGILASISGSLSGQGISLFALSTFDTDYILVKDKDFETAKEALRNAQIEIK